MSSNVFDKVAIVTGAASGIGKAVVKRLVDEGAKVTIVDINKEEGENYAKELNESKSSKVAIFQYADVSNFLELTEAFEVTLKTFGKINIVINNAGRGEGTDIWNIDADYETISKTVDINVKGTTYGTKLGLKYLLKNGEEGGCIINTSSVAGYTPSLVASIYASTKAAIISLSKSASLGGGKVNICVGVVCPSFTDTPIFPQHLREVFPKHLFVDMKDVVESYFKFLNDPKGLNGATISPLSTDNIVVEKFVDTFSAGLANANAGDLLNFFEQTFNENMKKMRES